MEATAQRDFSDPSARRGWCCDMVRGQNVAVALDQLRFTRKAAAPLVSKLLDSAIAQRAAEEARRRPRPAVRQDRIRATRRPTGTCAAGARARMGRATPIAEGHEPHHDRRSTAREEPEHGSEDTSVWLPPERHPHLEHPSGTRTSTTRSWLHEDLKLREAIKKKFANAGIAGIDDRARGQQGQGRDPHLASRHHHRQARRRRRAAQGRAAEAHRERAVHRHPGGPQGRDQRAARGREHRDPARASRRLPPRDEEGASDRDEVRRQGHPRAQPRAASAAPRSRATRSTARVACRCTRCAPTSSYGDGHRQHHRTARSASSAGSSRARCFRSAAARIAGQPQRPR